jgi:hypothetical protein
MEINNDDFLKSATIIKDPAIEPYFISKDSNCYTVYEASKADTESTRPKRGRKRVVTDENKDKIFYKGYGYYTTFEGCLNQIAKLKINKANYSTIKSYIDEYKRVKDELNQIINIGI